VRRGLTISLLTIMLIAVGALAATIATGQTPHLGLDLQGGASVVLQPKHKVKSGTLDQAIEIIRSRVDGLGVAEPQIQRQGSSIVVELPGVKNQKRALQIVGQTAQLLFRPVIQTLPPTDQAGQPPIKVTAPEQDNPRDTVVLPDKDKRARYALGPALVNGQPITGRIVSSATATVNQTTGAWEVDVQMTGSGGNLFDKFAQQVGQGKQFAFDLDGVVQSAPSLQTTSFNGKASITGTFTQSQAKNLALVLRYGSLPVQLVPQTVETVSATLGKDSLSAGIVAGAVGLGLVALYMVLYYRALGFVVWIGLAVSGALLYSIISYLGRSGLALSLAGVTGIIVSVGVTVDSYVVYFERLKDEIRSGKTIRSSVDRGFSRAYRTILAADLVSLIAAGLLYFLSVGAVRGFAFFLGLSTLLDLITAYFFTRPMVVLLGRNRLFTEARWVGVARGLAATSGESG
jgi:preprotein translocase subunit SecD